MGMQLEKRPPGGSILSFLRRGALREIWESIAREDLTDIGLTTIA